jgi:hypothetical protein
MTIKLLLSTLITTFISSHAHAACADISGVYSHKNGDFTITQTGCEYLRIDNVKDFGFGAGNIGPGLKELAGAVGINYPYPHPPYHVVVRPRVWTVDETRHFIKWLPSKKNEVNLFVSLSHPRWGLSEKVVTLKPEVDVEGNRVLWERVLDFEDYDFLN